MGKTLAEYLHKYKPSSEKFASILSSGRILDLRADKERRFMEIRADLQQLAFITII